PRLHVGPLETRARGAAGRTAPPVARAAATGERNAPGVARFLDRNAERFRIPVAVGALEPPEPFATAHRHLRHDRARFHELPEQGRALGNVGEPRPRPGAD